MIKKTKDKNLLLLKKSGFYSTEWQNHREEGEICFQNFLAFPWRKRQKHTHTHTKEKLLIEKIDFIFLNDENIK